MRPRSSLTWGLAASAASVQAQYLLSELSFGFGARITPENSHDIPNFSIQGYPTAPELLSNKIILTPPAPGNQRGAVWAEKTLEHDHWTADVNFRVNGPERGGGNLNIWLVRDGAHDVGTSSIYTVDRFEGLALVVDTYGGSGGMIRAFLNDGTTEYKSAHVDAFSFAHCNYAYRNLGRPSQIKLSQTEASFKVEVDGHLCFESDKVQIPPGYKFGITAASAENPDSTEVFKLAVLSDKHDSHHSTDRSGHQQHHYQDDHQHDHQHDQHHDQQKKTKKSNTPSRFSRAGGGAGHPYGSEEEWEEDLPDHEASYYTSSKAQFEDLHNRLQSVNHHLSAIFRQISHGSTIDERRHEETSGMIAEVRSMLGKLNDLDNRVQNVERELHNIRVDLSHKVQATENNIKNMVGDTHDHLSKKVEEHAASGHGRLLFIIIGSQVVLAVAYLVYKRRKSGMPKKYL